jgi:hypothetical protein
MSGWTTGQWLVDASGECVNVRHEDGGLIAQFTHLCGRHGAGGRRPLEQVIANATVSAASRGISGSLKAQSATRCSNEDMAMRDLRIRMMLIDYLALRGLTPAKRIRRGRLVRVCGLMFWRRSTQRETI